MRSTDATGLNRFNLFLSGNWSIDVLCVKPVATDEDCDSTSKNIIDKLKVRAKAVYVEDEKLCDENMCRSFLGAKDGKVRVVRRILGMCSGRYMTKHEFFYGTWYRQIVNLRAHELEYFRILNDHTTLDPEYPGAEDPAEVFTEKFSVSNAGRAMDKMDFASASFESNADDWFQIDLSRGGYIQFGEVTRGLRDVVQTFDYTDSETPDAPENQPGQYGQPGYKWINTPVTDGDDCDLDVQDPENPDFNFARIERTFVPLGIDIEDCPPDNPTCSPYYRSDEAERYSNYRDNPIVVGIRSDSYDPGNPPGPGNPNPCRPTLEVLLDDGGYSTSASVDLSGCESGIVGTRLYRGLAPGNYGFLADLGSETTYNDMQIKRDVSVRRPDLRLRRQPRPGERRGGDHGGRHLAAAIARGNHSHGWQPASDHILGDPPRAGYRQGVRKHGDRVGGAVLPYEPLRGERFPERSGHPESATGPDLLLHGDDPGRCGQRVGSQHRDVRHADTVTSEWRPS